METTNMLLIGVAAFMALCIFNGYRKGFLKIALSMAALVGTIMIVSILNPYVSKFLMDNTGLYEVLHESTSEFVTEIFESQIDKEINTRTDEVFAIDHLTLPKAIREKLIEDNNSVIYDALGVSEFEEYISRYLACMILNAISFIGTLVIAGFVVKVIFVMADIIEKVPGIKGMNKLAGMLLGFLQGIIIIWIGCLVVTAFGATKTGQEILSMIQDSVILSFIYNNNCLLLLVGNILKLLL
ncbi:MAG: CvpA family protein [Lachnospiraceae bacterium]|nr:CvpA family protein [Lachnospiraceae bacterium]